jgi:hypothetical protein
MDLIRKQTYITPEQEKALKRIAAEEHISEAEAIRRALEVWLAQRRTEGAINPLEAFTGWFSAKGMDDHDEIYR